MNEIFKAFKNHTSVLHFEINIFHREKSDENTMQASLIPHAAYRPIVFVLECTIRIKTFNDVCYIKKESIVLEHIYFISKINRIKLSIFY